MNDPTDPQHYKGKRGLEVIDVVEAFGLQHDAYLFNVVKYVLRHRGKAPETALTDLKKARWYLDRHIQNLEALEAGDEE